MDRTITLVGDPGWEVDESETGTQQTKQIERLYREHYDELKVFLMSRAHSKDTVEVVLQDVYLRLMEIDDLDVIRTPSAYLNRLAHNLLIDHQRRQMRQQRRLCDEPVDQMELSEQQPDLSEQMHYAQQLDVYRKIVAELPPPAEEILLLHRVEGLTHREIAEKFGKSKSWVEKTIAKTLLHCRKKLQESGY